MASLAEVAADAASAPPPPPLRLPAGVLPEAISISVVARGSRTVEVAVEPDVRAVRWSFHVSGGYDTRFSVTFEPATSAASGASGEGGDGGAAPAAVVELARMSSHAGLWDAAAQGGATGRLVLRWSNAFSLMRPQAVAYGVDIQRR